MERPDFETNEDARWQEALIANKIKYLEQVNSHNNRTKLKAKIAYHGKRLGGIWSDLNRVRKPRDTILRLAKPDTNPPQFETRSDRMANLASQYHDALQENGTTTTQQEHDPERDDAAQPNQETTEILNTIPETQKFDPRRFPELSK